ncbi:DUF6092 family protein [Streptomyces sp. NPDC041068]|uniref:DUF6092 family protein n=1 Tax=Streptomyces sp. NPDC041068 TaxID=3155130 RepID=UPI0033D7139F
MKSGETTPPRPRPSEVPDRPSAAPDRLHEDIALLAAYLLSSARGLLEEPPEYGVYRCLDGARRALEALDQNGVSTPELSAVRRRLDDQMFSPMGGDELLPEILDDVCMRLVDALQNVKSA